MAIIPDYELLTGCCKDLLANESNSHLNRFVCLFHLETEIDLTRKSDSGAIFWTNPHPLRSYPFPSFPIVSFDFLPLNLLLVRNHQAEIIIVKRLIQRRNNVCDEGWELNLHHAIVQTFYHLTFIHLTVNHGHWIA